MTVHLACAAKGRYVAHSAALLHSAAAHAPDLRVHYLHAPGLGRRARRRLERATGGAIDFHEVAPERVQDLPVREYFTEAMWYRLLLPELLPGVDRVLYLDVDTLVLDDLAPLWATNLDNAYLGAVTNVFQPDHLFHAAELGVRVQDYFNSGVLLLDLEALRRDDCMPRVRETAAARAGQRGWPDQDALNLVLGSRRAPLHPRWNVMNSVLQFDSAADVFGAEAVEEASRAPAIRHFEGPPANKPWRRGSRTAHRAEWRAHDRATRRLPF
jgi:lipopolysaccharide biosynthesis glycosyltransferase